MHSQSCLTLCDPTDCSPPGSLSMEFFRQEYWSGWPFTSTGDLPDRGIEPAGVQRQAVLYHWATWETNQVSIARRKGKATSFIHASQRPEQICIYSLIAGKSQERVSSWDANPMSREHSKGSGRGAVTGPPGKQWILLPYGKIFLTKGSNLLLLHWQADLPSIKNHTVEKYQIPQ